MYMTHCDMLIKFGDTEDPVKSDGQNKKEKQQKRRLKREKKLLANRLIIEKMNQMSQELSQI